MSHSKEGNLNFLTEAMARITGSLDIQTSLIDTFDFLEEHFPIDAISMHQDSVRLKSLKLLFLVQKGRFEFVETTARIPDEDAPWMKLFHDGLTEQITDGNSKSDPISRAHSKALNPWIEHKERGYLVGRLSSKTTLIGHLCLMGNGPDCFTEEHKNKLQLLLHPFALAMSNLLEHKRTIDFQQTLHAEQQQLRNDLELLRDTSIIGKEGGMKKPWRLSSNSREASCPHLSLVKPARARN